MSLVVGGGVRSVCAVRALPPSLYSFRVPMGAGPFVSPCSKVAARRVPKAPQLSFAVMLPGTALGACACGGPGPLAKTCSTWPQALFVLSQEKGPPYVSSMGGHCSQSRAWRRVRWGWGAVKALASCGGRVVSSCLRWVGAGRIVLGMKFGRGQKKGPVKIASFAATSSTGRTLEKGVVSLTLNLSLYRVLGQCQSFFSCVKQVEGLKNAQVLR